MKEFFACFFVFKVLIYFTIFLIHLARCPFHKFATSDAGERL